MLQRDATDKDPIPSYSYSFRDGAYRFEKITAPEPKKAPKYEPDNRDVRLNLAFVDSKGARVPAVEIDLEATTRTKSILDPWGDFKIHEKHDKDHAGKDGRYSWKGKAYSIFVMFSAPGFDDGSFILDPKDVTKEPVEIVLWKESDHKNVEVITAELKHKLALRRLMAAEKLRELRDPRAVPALIEALKDEDVQVQRWVIEALGAIGDERAVEPLSAIAKDEKMTWWSTAKDALKEIADAVERRGAGSKRNAPVPPPPPPEE